MGNIADKLNYLVETKRLIKQAIENKGVTVGNAAFRQYASLIQNIAVGTVIESSSSSQLSSSSSSSSLSGQTPELPNHNYLYQVTGITSDANANGLYYFKEYGEHGFSIYYHSSDNYMMFFDLYGDQCWYIQRINDEEYVATSYWLQSFLEDTNSNPDDPSLCCFRDGVVVSVLNVDYQLIVCNAGIDIVNGRYYNTGGISWDAPVYMHENKQAFLAKIDLGDGPCWILGDNSDYEYRYYYNYNEESMFEGWDLSQQNGVYPKPVINTIRTGYDKFQYEPETLILYGTQGREGQFYDQNRIQVLNKVSNKKIWQNDNIKIDFQNNNGNLIHKSTGQLIAYCTVNEYDFYVYNHVIQNRDTQAYLESIDRANDEAPYGFKYVKYQILPLDNIYYVNENSDFPCDVTKFCPGNFAIKNTSYCMNDGGFSKCSLLLMYNVNWQSYETTWYVLMLSYDSQCGYKFVINPVARYSVDYEDLFSFSIVQVDWESSDGGYTQDSFWENLGLPDNDYVFTNYNETASNSFPKLLPFSVARKHLKVEEGSIFWGADESGEGYWCDYSDAFIESTLNYYSENKNIDLTDVSQLPQDVAEVYYGTYELYSCDVYSVDGQIYVKRIYQNSIRKNFFLEETLTSWQAYYCDYVSETEQLDSYENYVFERFDQYDPIFVLESSPVRLDALGWENGDYIQIKFP